MNDLLLDLSCTMRIVSRTLPLLALCILPLLSCGGGNDTSASKVKGDTAFSAPASATILPGYQTEEVANGGTIRGRVLLDGAKPKLSGFEITANPDVCAGAADNNRLEVGSDGGIAWAVVRLVGVRKGKPMPTLSGNDLTVNQSGCRYAPHVVVAPVGGMVFFRNADPTPHNIRVEDGDESILMNVAQPRQGDLDTFRVEKIGPMSVGCDYHPWMNAYVFGVDNPYYALTGTDGHFEIAGIPPGEYELHMWLNGFQPTPKKDNRGNVIRYGFSSPYEESRNVTIAVGGSLEEEFRIKSGK